MRRLLSCLALLLTVGIFSARAEVRVSIECERVNYLLYAPVVVRVIIQNNTEVDLSLQSQGEPWLSFMVTRGDGFAVHTDQKLDVEPVVIKAGATKSTTMNLTPHYSFREQGNYKVRAVVDIPGQGQILSGNLQFNVVKGQTVLSRTRPLDGSERTYTLIRFSPDNTSTQLYLRVDDAKENLVYSTLELGPVTSTVVPPQLAFDKDGNLHILHTIGQGSYRYNRVSPTGVLENQSNYEALPEMPPRLTSAGDGAIMVAGGQVLNQENRRDRLSEAKFPVANAQAKTPAAAAPANGPVKPQ